MHSERVRSGASTYDDGIDSTPTTSSTTRSTTGGEYYCAATHTSILLVDVFTSCTHHFNFSVPLIGTVYYAWRSEQTSWLRGN